MTGFAPAPLSEYAEMRNDLSVVGAMSPQARRWSGVGL